jgi:hypothetical protein
VRGQPCSLVGTEAAQASYVWAMTLRELIWEKVKHEAEIEFPPDEIVLVWRYVELMRSSQI